MRLTLAKRYISTLFWNWVCSADDQRFVERFNFVNRWLLKYPIRCQYLSEGGCLALLDGTERRLAFVNRRAIIRFHGGIENRLETLAAEYLVMDCGIAQSDVVIDIGANIGEFTYYCCVNFGTQVLAIEPDLAYENALTFNLNGLDATYLAEALWSEDTDLVIYHCRETDDTSLIEPVKYDSSEMIRVVTLDGLISKKESELGRDFEKFKLVKIEAEGAEPEIIAGAHKTLLRTEYVTVDCGPERGVKQESTLVPVVNALLELGFELVEFQAQRMVVLMRNGALDSSNVDSL